VNWNKLKEILVGKKLCDLTDEQVKRVIRNRNRVSRLFLYTFMVVAVCLLYVGVNGVLSLKGFSVVNQLDATSYLAVLLGYGSFILTGIFVYAIGVLSSLTIDNKTDNMGLALKIRQLKRELEAKKHE
jgi:hypothetical protein